MKLNDISTPLSFYPTFPWGNSLKMRPILQRLISASVIVVVALLASTTVTAQPGAPWACDNTLYIATQITTGPSAPSSDLVSVDRATGALNPLGNSPDDYNGLAYNPVDNFLYSVDEATGAYYQIGNNAVAVNIGSVGAPPNAGNSWWASEFWFNPVSGNWEHLLLEGGTAANHTLYRVDPTGPVALPGSLYGQVNIGPTATEAGLRWGDMTVHPFTNVVYGSPDNDRALYTINPLTGVANRIGDMVDINGDSHYAAAMFFDIYGQLWAYTDINPGPYAFVNLVRIDTATGAVELVATGNPTTRSDGAACPFGVVMEKTVAPPSVAQGGMVTYTYVLTNNSDTTAVGLDFVDALPALPDQRTYIAGTATTTSGAIVGGYGGTKTLQIDNLTVPRATPATTTTPRIPGIVTITVSVAIGATPPGPATNQASLTGLTTSLSTTGTTTSDDPDTFGYPDNTILTVTAAPDLAITKDDTITVYTPGAPVAYTITVTNVGGLDAVGATVTDTFPPQLLNVTWTCAAAGGAVCGNAAGAGALNETVDVPTTGTITYTVNADIDAAATGNITNTATVFHPADANPLNDSATDTDTPPGGPVTPPTGGTGGAAAASAPSIVTFIDPSLSKIGFLEPGETGIIGETLEWIFTVRNNGTLTATNVVISDTLHPGLRIDSIDLAVGSSNISGQTVTVTIPSLAPGQSVVFNVFTTVLNGNAIVENVACMTADSVNERCVTGFIVTELPQTGETPWWRDDVLLLLGIITVVSIGGASLMLHHRRKPPIWTYRGG